MEYPKLSKLTCKEHMSNLQYYQLNNEDIDEILKRQMANAISDKLVRSLELKKIFDVDSVEYTMETYVSLDNHEVDDYLYNEIKKRVSEKLDECIMEYINTLMDSIKIRTLDCGAISTDNLYYALHETRMKLNENQI